MWKNKLVCSSILLFLLLKGSTNYCFASFPWSETNTSVVLTKENFHSKVKHYDILLVMFYVTWCSHCRRLHPDFDRAATELLQNSNPPIFLAKFDCTKDKEAQCSRRFGIDYYPTLRIYRSGRFNREELNYGNRTTDEIVKTMRALQKDGEQQTPTWYHSSQTEGVKDEVNNSTTSTACMWLLIGLLVTHQKAL